MKVTDVLKLMQLMPQVSKLAGDIIWPSPKTQKTQSRRSPGLCLISTCAGFTPAVRHRKVSNTFHWLAKLPGINSILWHILPLTTLTDNVVHLHQALPPWTNNWPGTLAWTAAHPVLHTYKHTQVTHNNIRETGRPFRLKLLMNATPTLPTL